MAAIYDQMYHQKQRDRFDMNEQWRQYLQHQGACFGADKDRVDHFGHLDVEQVAIATGNIITPITGTATIRAVGEDAKTFLQGQLTNDIGLIDRQTSQLSGYCNPKGRLLALFRITQDDQGYSLHLPAELTEKTLARLRMFVLMAKVTLEATPAEVVRIGVAGDSAASSLGALFDTIPDKENGVATVNDATIIRLPGAAARFEIIGDIEAMQAVWQHLSGDLTPVGSEVWQRLDIEAGLPCVVTETVEMFIPQMLNLHVIDGVSFKKGCYPGQEVVARLHYRGKLKRHMHIAQFSADHCPAPGTPLYAANEGADGQSIGNIVQASSLPDNQCLALCVIANEFSVDNGACLQGDAKATLKLHDLPCPFPSETE